MSDTIVKEITINASAEHVFEVLVNPDEVVKWWGSEGPFHTTHMESDLRPGGEWTVRGFRRNGEPFTIIGAYSEIARPRLLVLTWRPDWKESASTSYVRVDLEEENGITIVRLTHTGSARAASDTSHRRWPPDVA